MSNEETKTATATPPESAEKSPAPEQAAAPAHPAKRPWRLIIIGVLAVVALIYGIPAVMHALNTVSTDDAYVNSYVTFVAPRVAGQVARVLVEDNNRVKKGDVLVELDPEP